ncbi:hypothetical protein L798_13217 [Zootermopsis nevadensis]|uniref:Uncharacterized protein n=1 Tax=Zootermopsis nevadensis TaxID=136037 RepID=A0A067QTE9_ZOONE|nr:hypothetical protein L798_13217 [Zootermopsis nevadensis]
MIWKFWQVTLHFKFLPLGLDTAHQPIFVTVCCSIHDRCSLDTVIASKLTHPIVMQDGSIRGHIKRPMTWNKLPDEVIACLNHELRPTQILGALFMWMQLASPTSLA